MPLPPADTDRLNGWKEISAFLGKSVRTVQRWEREFGLPVHRVGSAGSEVVFAWREELARWSRSAAQAAPGAGAPADAAVGPGEPAPGEDPSNPGATGTPAQRSRWPLTPLWTTLLGVAAAVAVAGVVWTGRAVPGERGPDRQPAGWRLEDDQLVVLDEGGHALWSRRFEEDLAEDAYVPRPLPDPAQPAPSVRIEDLDGDGSREVLFAARRFGVTRPSLYVFEADGRLRFSHAPPATALRFGDTTYPPEWLIIGTWVTRNSRNERSIWALYYHKPYFPSLLTQLDARGTVRSEYVSNGYIHVVHEARWKGSDVVLVGAVNNETQGGGLAIFESGTVRGSAPAENPKYRCDGCAPGGPDHFVVFPRTCLSSWAGSHVPIGPVWVDDRDAIWVVTSHDDELKRPAGRGLGAVTYVLDRNLAPIHVEFDAQFVQLHQEAEAKRTLTHPLDERDAQRALPARIWRDARFVDLPRVRPEIDR